MSGSDPRGGGASTVRGPDGKPLDENNAPYNWTIAERERGAIRQSGSRPFATAYAVTSDDGTAIGAGVVPSLAALVYEIQQLRRALVLAEVAADLGDLG